MALVYKNCYIADSFTCICSIIIIILIDYYNYPCDGCHVIEIDSLCGKHNFVMNCRTKTMRRKVMVSLLTFPINKTFHSFTIPYETIPYKTSTGILDSNSRDKLH